MHGLHACLFKYSTVATFRIYAQRGEDAAKGEVGGHALNSHGNYIVDHGKSWKKHGNVFLNFCGNPADNIKLTGLKLGRNIVNKDIRHDNGFHSVIISVPLFS